MNTKNKQFDLGLYKNISMIKRERIKAISKGELKKHNWQKCKIKNENWVFEGEVYVDKDDDIYILSDNPMANGYNISKRWYKYAWGIYTHEELDGWMDNSQYKRIELEVKPEVKYVYVSDRSIEEALIGKRKRIFIMEVPWKVSWKYLCVNDGYEKKYLNWDGYEYSCWGYIADIAETPTDEIIEIPTKDWKTISITKEKLKEIWFNI